MAYGHRHADGFIDMELPKWVDERHIRVDFVGACGECPYFSGRRGRDVTPVTCERKRDVTCKRVGTFAAIEVSILDLVPRAGPYAKRNDPAQRRARLRRRYVHREPTVESEFAGDHGRRSVAISGRDRVSVNSVRRGF